MAKRGWRGDKANMVAGHTHRPQSYRDQKITVKREFVAALANLSHLSVPEITAVAQSQELPALQVLMGAIVLDAIDGDSHARTILLDRLFGKVADAVDVSHTLEIDPELARIPEAKLVEILELSESMDDTTQGHDQRREDRLPGETEGHDSPEPSAGRLRHPATGRAEGMDSATEPQRANQQASDGRARGYKVTSMEIGDTLLEAGWIAEKYQGDAAKKG